MPRRPWLLAAAVAAALLAGGCSSAPPPSAPTAAPTATAPTTPPPTTPPPAELPPDPLAWQPCEDGFECAPLTVRLDPDDPTKGTIDLAVTRRPVADPEQRIGSLMVNPGGPGASAVDYLQGAWEQVPEAVRARFDLVAFDPRGVGRSAPVQCATTAELDAYFALDPDPDDAGELAALEQGSRELAQGCAERTGPVLAHVSTAQVARDLDRLRAAVGDERLTYLGYSYGTSIGAEYLRQFPERVRAMVLDGAVDPTLSWDELLAGQSRGFDVALQAFLADCEQRRCAFRQVVDGDLGAAYDRLAARVEQERLPADGSRTVGPGEFSLGVGAALYSRESGWPVLAQALAEASRDGTGATLLALSDSYLMRTPEGYANLTESNFAVNCVDRPWPTQTQPYVELAEQVAVDAPRFGPAIALSGLACASWPVPPQSEPAPVRAEGAAPVVVVGTTRDPATPYAWSQSLADQLASAVLVTYDGDGHTVYRTGAPECVRRPVDDYLLTGQAPAGPVSC